MIAAPLLLANISIWLTPLWLLGVGIGLGLLVLGILYGLAVLFTPRFAETVRSAVREGILLPILLVAVFMAGFALVATLVVPYHELLAAVARLPSVGYVQSEITVPPATKDFMVPLPFRFAELDEFRITSDQPLTVVTQVKRGAGQNGAVSLVPSEPFLWKKANPVEKVFESTVDDWSATNLSDKPAVLDIEAFTEIEYPEVRIVPIAAYSLIGLFTVYLLLRLLSPKVAAVAATTAKESMAQPLFYVAMTLGAVALIMFVVVPYNTFGEDVKMLKDSSLTLIMLLSILVAVWSASVSISDEIEGRTALTLLSKPVTRRQFILGKFLGILWPVVLMFVVLGLLFLTTVSYKVVYDARETAQQAPTWQACYWEMVGIVPGLILAFFETVVLAAISVAISTKLPMLANLIICSSIYVLGHLVPMLVKSSVGKFNIVLFFGQFLATVLPVLDHFNIQASIAAGASVPASYLWWALAYCVLYTSIAMLAALALFEDRDLA